MASRARLAFKMNRKGIVFTFIVVVLLSVILIAFLINIRTQNVQSKIQENNIKIETLNSFNKALKEQIIPQAIKSSSNRAVLALLQHLDEVNIGAKSTSGVFINSDLNSVLKNAMIKEEYGLFHLNDMVETTNEAKTNYTLPSIFEEIKTLAENTGIDFSYSALDNVDVEIIQLDAWTLSVTVEGIDYKVSDFKGETFWDLNDQSFSTILDVTNYRDPFMLVFDDRNLTINKTEITNWDLANFKLFYQRPEFRQHDDAPSFLDRLKGSFSYSTPNTNGIETVLDLNYYNASKDYSNIDFHYWKKSGPLACEVDGISIPSPSGETRYLYLDNQHLSYYNRLNGGDQDCNTPFP